MMNTFWYRGPRLWVQGLLLFALRLAQLRTGFDSETGLAVASLTGTLLAEMLAVCAAAELVLCLRLPGENAAFDVQFARPERAVPCLVAGSFLLAAGGALLLASLAAGTGAVLLGERLGNRLAARIKCNISWLSGLVLIGLAFFKLT